MVYEYLIHHGIPGSRMSYAGYGNWQMEYPKAVYEEENAANRRVEIKILQVN
jgi:flagellar motor protein MotB